MLFTNAKDLSIWTVVSDGVRQGTLPEYHGGKSLSKYDLTSCHYLFIKAYETNQITCEHLI